MLEIVHRGPVPMNAPPHVLIMDECAEVRDLLRDILRPAGYRLTLWHDLLDLAAVRALQPDVIIMERRFADATGAAWLLLREIRRDPALARTPIVLSTTAAPPGPAARVAAELAADGIHLLLKPYAVQDLLTCVQGCLRPDLAPRPPHPSSDDAHRHASPRLRLVRSHVPAPPPQGPALPRRQPLRP